VTVELGRPVLNVGIVTVNLDRMSRFYSGFFGFKALREIVIPGAGAVHRFVAGDSMLRLMVPEEQPQHDGAAGEFLSATGYRYMTLSVNDIETAAREAAEYGGEVTYGPAEFAPGVKIAQLRDPDGNWIELLQEA
jgi:lactoylglutathione lyase